MKKIIAATIMIFAMTSASFSQMKVYHTGIGFRAGLSQGVTVKHFFSNTEAFEGLFTTKWQGFEISGLYEKHNFRTFDVDGLYWFYGFGAHIGFFNGENVRWGELGKQYVAVGADAIIGMEYTFTEAPISLSLDIKPGFNFTGYVGFWYDAAFSIRYIF